MAAKLWNYCISAR